MNEPLALVIATAHVTATLALYNGIVTCIGQGKIASTALDSIARQPEAAGSIRTTMLIGLAMAETGGIYGLLISIIMLFANPLVAIYLQNAM